LRSKRDGGRGKEKKRREGVRMLGRKMKQAGGGCLLAIQLAIEAEPWKTTMISRVESS